MMAEHLFDRELSFCLKTSGQDDKRSSIRVTLELESLTTPLMRKELHVRLTNDADPFFLYNLALSEDDFQSLKIQQGLLVDFGAFPQKFIELLERCGEEEHKELPRFILHLTRGDTLDHGIAELSVVETNPFKHLTHLALKLQPGNDGDVKKYLAKCLKTLQEDHRQVLSRLSSTESSLSQQLQHAQHALATKTQELETLRAEWNSHSESLVSKQKQEMAEEKQQALQAQCDVEKQYSREKHGLETKHQNQLKQLETLNSELQTANKELTDKRYRLESNVRELKSRLTTSEEENQRMQQELRAIRQQSGDLQVEKRGREQTLSQLQTKIAVLQQELYDKETLVTKSNELLQVANENKNKLQESVQQKSTLIAKLERTVKSTSQEVLKGNEIIKKLQGELKANLAKLKLKNTVATKQEKLLEEKSQTLTSQKQELVTLSSRIQQLESENQRLNESLENVRGKLEESKQLLKTNENVINWLNKQVNEVQLTRKPAGMFDGPAAAGPQVTYKPAHTPLVTSTSSNPSSRPWSNTIMTHTSSIPPIPEEISPTPRSTVTRPAVVMSRSSEPALDMKYLQQKHIQQTGVQGGGPFKPSSGPKPGGPSYPNTSTPGSNGAPSLMSAYFPQQLQTTT